MGYILIHIYYLQLFFKRFVSPTAPNSRVSIAHYPYPVKMQRHMQLHAAGNVSIDALKAPLRVTVGLPKRTRRVLAVAQQGGLTSNSSLLGPSLNNGTPSLGPKLGSSSQKAPTISVADVPLESKVGRFRWCSFFQSSALEVNSLPCTGYRYQIIRLTFSTSSYFKSAGKRRL